MKRTRSFKLENEVMQVGNSVIRSASALNIYLSIF